jgi:hypothetical protein
MCSLPSRYTLGLSIETFYEQSQGQSTRTGTTLKRLVEPGKEDYDVYANRV